MNNFAYIMLRRLFTNILSLAYNIQRLQTQYIDYFSKDVVLCSIYSNRLTVINVTQYFVSVIIDDFQLLESAAEYEQYRPAIHSVGLKHATTIMHIVFLL